jgi:hypothetical protein
MLIIVCSQILALVVFGVSIWALVDAPSFLDLFELVIYVSSIPGKMFFFLLYCTTFSAGNESL